MHDTVGRMCQCWMRAVSTCLKVVLIQQVRCCVNTTDDVNQVLLLPDSTLVFVNPDTPDHAARSVRQVPHRTSILPVKTSTGSWLSLLRHADLNSLGNDP